MTKALLEALPMAVVIAVFPVPVIAVVVLLSTPRARTVSPLFVVGWVVALGVLGTAALVLADAADPRASGSPATWVSIVKLVVAAALVVLGWHTYRTRPRGGEEPPLPRWMSSVEAMSPTTAFLTGAALAGLNPKNVLLTVAGAASIAETGIPGAQQALSLALFVVVASLGVGAPLVAFFVAGARVLPVLEHLRAFMARHMAVIVTGLCALIAAVLTSEAVAALGS